MQLEEHDEHEIEANNSLIRSVILDQTDNLEKGWREAAQNSIDSDATVFRLNYDKKSSFMDDNGSGVELSEQKGIDLLRIMGNSSKESGNHSNIGEFGIGKGQIIAKGKTAFISGDTALLFDIKNWGLVAKSVATKHLLGWLSEEDEGWERAVASWTGELGDSYDGLGIVVKHYSEEVPSDGSHKWNQYEERFAERFQYLSSVRDTEIVLSGETISDKDPLKEESFSIKKHVEEIDTEKTGKVYLRISNSYGNLDVYSGGIRVTSIPSRGIVGSIVTNRNLQLNFARNEIKSGCEIWSAISERLDKIRDKFFLDETVRLSTSARKYVAEQIFLNERIEKFSDTEAFQLCDESFVSINEIGAKNEIGFSPVGDSKADQLISLGYLVFNENDPAVDLLQQNLEEYEVLPSTFTTSKKANEHSDVVMYETINESSLASRKNNKLGIARYVADLMGWDGEVKWGKSDFAQAWTDGETEITFTDSCAPSSKWVCWVPSLHNTLVHELAHEKPDKEDSSHGVEYHREFRDLMEGDGLKALVATQEKIKDEGLRSVAESGHKSYLD